MDEATELAATAPAGEQAPEAGSLAGEMARAYVRTVRFLCDQMQVSQEDASGELASKAELHLERLRNAPPDEISWLTLGLVGARHPELAQAGWERIKAEARDELESGHRAAVTLEWHREPWQRAQFLAIRQAFIDAWQPRGGIELALIDTMAQAHTMYLMWLSRAHVQAVTEGEIDEHQHRQYGFWKPPRMDVAAAMDQSAAMADRFQRMFSRTLRALRDLRRYAPSVVVQNAGQVNVGGQQVNVGAVTTSGVPGDTGRESMPDAQRSPT